MHSRPRDEEAIKRRMARIRRNRHDGVHKAIASADAVMDWGSHAGTYAISAIGAAAAVVVLYVAAGARSRAGATEQTELTSERATARQRMMSGAGGFLGRLAARAAQNYLAHCLEEWITPRRAGHLTNGAEADTVREPALPFAKSARLRLTQVGQHK